MNWLPIAEIERSQREIGSHGNGGGEEEERKKEEMEKYGEIYNKRNRAKPSRQINKPKVICVSSILAAQLFYY